MTFVFLLVILNGSYYNHDSRRSDFTENQIIIECIYKYDFERMNVIEIVNRLVEG